MAISVIAFVCAMGVGFQMAFGQNINNVDHEYHHSGLREIQQHLDELDRRVDNLEKTSCTWTWPFEQPEALFRRIVQIQKGEIQ